MSSAIKKLKLNTTPNSSKLAEILLQLKDESIPLMEPQNILDGHDLEDDDPVEQPINAFTAAEFPATTAPAHKV
jgi:hypothetical protein